MKKTLLLLCLLLTSTFAMAYDFEVDGIYYDIYTYENSNVAVSYNSKLSYTGEVIIPSTVTYDNITYNVKSINYNAFKGCSSLTSVTIPESVTSIGTFAFDGCTGLKKVEFANIEALLNTSFSGRSANPLYYAHHLYINGEEVKNLVVPPNITSPYIDQSLIGCYFESIVVEEGNTVYDSRDNCNAIIETASNTMIVGCKSTTIPNNVVSIKTAFTKGCGPTTLTIPNNVERTDLDAFYGCTGIKNLYIEEGKNNDDYLSLSGSSEFNIKESSIETMFIGRTITYNGHLSNPISGNLNLKSLFIGRFVYDFSDMTECGNLNTIEVEEGNTIFDSRNNCNAIIRTSDNLLIQGCNSTIIPESVVYIANKAFANCCSLISITIPESVTGIYDNAFSGCKLRNVMVKREVPPYSSTISFSEQTYYHTTLYIPTGAWEAYAYDDAWYRFINIRETATASSEVSAENTYTLMDAKSFVYTVYDPVNDRLGTVSSIGVDENNPNHCWQAMEVDGKQFLYNIGAKKFAVPATDGSSFTLSDTVGSLSMTDGEDGVVFNNHNETQWALVANERMSIDESVEETIVTAIESINANLNLNAGAFYDLNGRQVTNPTKGIYIRDGKKVLVK